MAGPQCPGISFLPLENQLRSPWQEDLCASPSPGHTCPSSHQGATGWAMDAGVSANMGEEMGWSRARAPSCPFVGTPPVPDGAPAPNA